MRRRLTALLLIFVVAASVWLPVCSAEEPKPTYDPSSLTEAALDCEAAILIDADSGDVLFSKNDRIRMHPASCTKIMTLLLGVESGIDFNQQIAVPQAAADVPKDSTLIPVFPGETMTFGDLLQGFMLASGNDGANAIAVIVGGSVQNFVQMMNQRAAELGCQNTHFANPHGYTADGHYTTAYDLALITKEAMKNDDICRIVGNASATIHVNERGDLKLKSKHYMMQSDSQYYYADCVGVKTGTTSAAGQCFVGAAERNGATLISVVLNCTTEAKRWIDTAKLFEYGWLCYDTYTLDQMYEVASPQIASFVISNAAEDDAGYGQLKLNIAQISNSSYIRMIEKDNADALNRAAEEFISRSKVEITHSLTAPISLGEIIGSYSYTDPDTGNVINATLVSSRDVAEKTVRAKLSDYFPFLRIFSNRIFLVLLVVLAILILLIIILAAVRKAEKQRRRRQIYERRRQEYLRQQHAQKTGSQAPRRSEPGNPVTRRPR